ncbi:unnamed protein product [Malus baccata var. baccata]
MVTASQLQILQSPITGLISSVSTSVNVKLDDSNYLNWHFQMELMLEGYGIMGFVDGSSPCPPRFVSSSSVASEVSYGDSSANVETDEYKVWKMHDRALMQLITATLSPVAVSCAIGSTSSQDIWTRLKDNFSTVSRTSIFQMKSDLQNIKKGSNTISQYLQRIKEARDYLSAAGVFFEDEDIVILALNGLPPEYNTFQCVIRGREKVISLKEFRSQLLAEEGIVDASLNAQMLSAMLATNSSTTDRGSSDHSSGHSSNSGQSNYGFRQYNNKYKGKGKFTQGNRFNMPRQSYNTQTRVLPTPSPGLLGHAPQSTYGSYP